MRRVRRLFALAAPVPVDRPLAGGRPSL